MSAELSVAASIPREFILQQLYLVSEAGNKFRYAHYKSDITSSLYVNLVSKEHQRDIYKQSLNLSACSHPFSLIYYRQVFHQTLAANQAFINRLTHDNINQDRYFRDMEKVLRVCFYEQVEQQELGRSVLNAVSYRMARTHATQLSQYYFRGNLAGTIARIAGLDSQDDEALERLHGALWAVDLAFPYTAALLDMEFYASQLVDAERGFFKAPYTTEQINVIFESGFHLSRHMTTQVIPEVETLGVSRAQLSRMLEDEMARIGRKQRERDLIERPEDIYNISQLVHDAVTEYEPELLDNLSQRCVEMREAQERSTRAMQYALASEPANKQSSSSPSAPTDEPDEANPLQQALASAGFGGTEDEMTETVVDAGRQIISYLKNINMGEEADESSEEKQADTTPNEQTSTTTAPPTPALTQLDLTTLTYEIVMDEERQQRQWKEIRSLLKSGLTVRFVSPIQALTFHRSSQYLLGDHAADIPIDHIHVRINNQQAPFDPAMFGDAPPAKASEHLLKSPST